MGLRQHRGSREHHAKQAWLARHQNLTIDQQQDLENAYRMALQAILRGYGTEQAWHTLACTLNVAMLLCEHGYRASAIAAIKQAQQALINCQNRAIKHGRYGFTGDEARQVIDAINIHDEQASLTTRAKVAEALREVHRRIESGDAFQVTGKP